MCREGFIFKCFEFGGYKTFGIFKGLPTLIIEWNFIELALADLNIKTVHTVVLHLKRRNTGTGFFALFQLFQAPGKSGDQTDIAFSQVLGQSANLLLDGAADLRGLSTHERAERLISLADPAFRRALAADWAGIASGL